MPGGASGHATVVGKPVGNGSADQDPKIVLPGVEYFASFPAVIGWPLFGLPKTSGGRQPSGIEDVALTSTPPEPPLKHPE